MLKDDFRRQKKKHKKFFQELRVEKNFPLSSHTPRSQLNVFSITVKLKLLRLHD